MEISRINNMNFKSNYNTDNKKVLSANQVLGVTLGTWLGTGTVASIVCNAKKIKHPIFNGFEIGAAIGILATIVTHSYNAIVNYKNKQNNKG